MIVPAQAVRVVVATKPVDFCKGHDGLAAIVERELDTRKNLPIAAAS
jgi:transposase